MNSQDNSYNGARSVLGAGQRGLAVCLSCQSVHPSGDHNSGRHRSQGDRAARLFSVQGRQQHLWAHQILLGFSAKLVPQGGYISLDGHVSVPFLSFYFKDLCTGHHTGALPGGLLQRSFVPAVTMIRFFFAKASPVGPSTSKNLLSPPIASLTTRM